jgi:O-antigen/teichoic acid export membrane protein
VDDIGIAKDRQWFIFGLVGKIKNIAGRSFVRNVAIVASGTAAAQLITMAFAPVITRLYGPNAYGLLGTFSALVGALTPIAALAYPIAIVLPKEDSDAIGIARLSAYISLGVAAVVAIVLLAGGAPLLALVGSDAIAAVAMLIPLNVLFSAWLQIIQQWLIRKKQFQVTAKVTVAQSLIVSSAKAGIGWFNPAAAVLIVVTTIGQVVYAAMLYLSARRANKGESQVRQPETSTPLFDLGRSYYDFPLYRAPQVFINAISQSLPVLMLSAFFGPASAGFYVLGKRLISMPSQLIGHSVGSVFYPRITEAAHKGENLTRLIIKATLALSAIGFMPFAVIIAFGPWLFGFVFGADWVVAGEYARWLSLWTFFMFLNNPSVKAIPILSAQGFHLVFTLFTIATRILVLAVGYYIFNSDVIAVALFGTSGALINIALITIILFKSKVADSNRLDAAAV